jgi:hypothetical protein
LLNSRAGDRHTQPGLPRLLALVFPQRKTASMFSLHVFAFFNIVPPEPLEEEYDKENDGEHKPSYYGKHLCLLFLPLFLNALAR